VTANQFYVAAIAPGAARIIPGGDEHRHPARAARVRPGEEIRRCDGAGRRSRARVEKAAGGPTEIEVLSGEAPESLSVRIVLAPCLIEARTLESVLEKAAELGCAEFVPVVSARSCRPARDGAGRKLERWTRIVRETAKQCNAAPLTEVRPPRPLKELLREPGEGLKLFLSEHGGRPLRELLAGAAPSRGTARGRVVLLVGPKGGWTAGEEREIREAGFEAVSLGRRVLRAETAAVAGAAMIAHFWNG
jgi:16S rRNA (uracil1498-N3)-methyltransferase